MDLKCKNCSQFIAEGDKYCRYCGCPAPVKPEEPKLKARELQDAISVEKTTIHEEEIAECEDFDYDKLIVKSKGEVNVLRMRALLTAIFTAVLTIGCFVAAILLVRLEIKLQSAIKYVIVMFVFAALFIALAYFYGAVSKMKMYSLLAEMQIVVPRFSLRSTPLFMLGNFVFSLDVSMQCPICDGEIKGDLHIEKINNQTLVICNYNRKHFYRIPEAEFFAKYLGVVKNLAGVETDTGASDIDTINNSLLDTTSEVQEPSIDIVNKE